MRKKLSLCLFIVLLSGCATTDDPRHGGLFSYNPTAYERRLGQRREHLATVQQDQQHEEEQQRLLESDVQSKQDILETERERLRVLDHDLERLQANITRYQARSKAQQSEKQRLGKEAKRLKGQIVTLRNNHKLAQEEKEKQIASLQRDMLELSQHTSQLAQ